MCNALVLPHGLRRRIFHCSALDSPHGLKNDVYFIVARLFRLMAQKTTFISCVAFFSPHGLKNDGCYMCSALVSPYGSKNDQCYICSALFSRHGFKNDVHFKCSALVCLMDERYFHELTSGEFDRLLPGRTVSIGSDRVCLPISSIPLAHVNLLLPVPPVKRHTAISGSGRNRTQSACW